MENSQLIHTILPLAQAAGICRQGYDHILSSNLQQLIQYYINMPDWCLERNFPPLDILRRLATDLRPCGIYIDTKFNNNTFNRLQTYIFHNCTGNINIEMDYRHAVIPMLYFANNCSITISCNQQNNPPIKIPIYVFGENNISINHSSGARFIFHHND